VSVPARNVLRFGFASGREVARAAAGHSDRDHQDQPDADDPGAFWFCPATARTDGASTVTAATLRIRLAMIISQPVSHQR
jgi:hypothetical protein